MSEAEDKLAVRVSRAITRRRSLERAMRTALVAGVSASALILRAWQAEGANCSTYGMPGTWGTVCNPARALCGGSNCTSGNCAGNARKRCDYWADGPNVTGKFCWCSDTACHSGKLGHYTCCDCWLGSTSGNCATANTGDTKCLCQKLVLSSTNCT
jgi:hypothetical protein